MLATGNQFLCLQTDNNVYIIQSCLQVFLVLWNCEPNCLPYEYCYVYLMFY